MAQANDQTKGGLRSTPLAEANLRRVEHEALDARFRRTPPSEDPWTPLRCSSTSQQGARVTNSEKPGSDGNKPKGEDVPVVET